MPINSQALQPFRPLIPHAPPETIHERQAIGRIAAVVWAAIAFFGALATVGPLRFAEMDLSETKLVVLSATVMAAITVVLPWPRLPRAAVNVLLIAMAGYITALAHASGAVHDAPTMSVTFVVALAICFLPVRTSVAEVVLIALLLAGGLYLLGTQEADVQALRTLLLLSGLVVLCGLVLILRSTIAAREAAAGRRIFNEDLLDERATRKRLDLELAATARDGGRLSLVLIEVTRAPDRDELDGGHLAAELGGAILERIRLTDRAGRLGGLRFVVIAPDRPDRTATDSAGLARVLEQVVGEQLESLGRNRGQFAVATGWADNADGTLTAEEILEAARERLQAAALATPA